MEIYPNLLCKHPITEGIILLFYTPNPFIVNAAIVDRIDHKKVIWISHEPIWSSKDPLNIKDILVKDRTISISYYMEKKLLKIFFNIDELKQIVKKPFPNLLIKPNENPILTPNSEHPWESIGVFNAGAIYLDGKIHILYRAVGDEGLSALGYASSLDGIHIEERLSYPIYFSMSPSKDCHYHLQPYPYQSGMSWFGCEDPRLTLLDDTIYMVYTAFDGYHPPCVAMTSISKHDFLCKKWNWKKPLLLSPPGEKHKNWVFFPEKINGQYAMLHRITPDLGIHYFDHLEFNSSPHIKSSYSPSGREDDWDNWTRGIGPPPIRTEEGWLILYHAMDYKDPDKYKIGAMLLDINDPTKILHRSSHPLFEPDQWYENEGFKPGVVYACGAIVMDQMLYIYYGGADTFVCVAYVPITKLVNQIKSSMQVNIIDRLLPCKQGLKNDRSGPF